MNVLQKRFGPFAHPPQFGKQTHTLTCDVESRIAMVRISTDAEWLEAVIKHRHTQKTVKLAAKRRLRMVSPEETR